MNTTAAQKPDGFGKLQSEQALLHARAITEWIRAALASRPEVLEQAAAWAALQLSAHPADGSRILLPPTGSETGARNGELFFLIKAWARATGR